MNKIFLLVGLLITLNTSANDNVTLDVAGQNINIGLENEVTYCAFQMDLTLPTGIRVTSVNKASRLNVNDDLTANFVVDSNIIGDNIYRILCYNTSNQPIVAKTGNLLNLTLDATVTGKVIAYNIRFVNANDLSEAVLANAETQILDDISTNMDTVKVDTDIMTFNLNGQRITNNSKGIRIVRSINGVSKRVK